MDNYFVIFGGGGIRGITYCGAYKALIENNIQFSGIAGSSIGAVFAVLLAFDYSYEEIFEIFTDTGLGIFSDFNFDFKKELAFSKGQKAYEWMKQKIEQKFYSSGYKKGKMPPVKFCDIDKNLVVYSVDLSNMEYKEFSREATPDYEIALAIRASISMPFLFTPHIDENGNYIVDGDLLKPTPLWRVSNTIKNSTERILEFRLEDSSKDSKITNSIDYINRVYNTICTFATDYIIDLYGEKDKFDYIKIDTPQVSIVDFLIPKQKKQELFDIGYNVTNNYLKDELSKKRTYLLSKYNNILISLLDFQKSFSKKDYCASYLTLCELFVYLCEEKRYIDVYIYQKILELKDLFFENYIKTSFLFFGKGKLKNKHNEIYDFLLEIIKILTLKTQDLG